METGFTQLGSLECAVISPLRVLYLSTQSVELRAGSLKILLHVLEVICNNNRPFQGFFCMCPCYQPLFIMSSH